MVFEMQHQYAFFYQDTLEVIRFDETIRDQYRNHIQWEKDQLCRLIEFNISRGALIPIETTEIKKKADQLWLIENSWFHYALIIGQESIETSAFKDHMWQMFLPQFTHIGQQEYDQLVRTKKIPL